MGFVVQSYGKEIIRTKEIRKNLTKVREKTMIIHRFAFQKTTIHLAVRPLNG
jgi:hypothetical protein